MTKSDERFNRVLAWAEARRPSDAGINPWAVTVRLVRNTVDDRVAGLAAEMSFWALLSMLPLMVTIAALMGYAERWVGSSELEQGRAVVVGALSVVFSRELINEVVNPFVGSLLTNGRGGIAATTLIVGLYLASRVFTATIRSLDLAYRVEERRGLVMQRLLAIALATGFVIVVVATLMVMVVGPLLGSGQSVADWMGLGVVFQALWTVARWPFLLLTMVAFLAAVYLWGPNVENSFRSCLPGAVLGVVTWTLASLGLRYYLAAGGGGTPAITTEDQAVALVGRVVGVLVAMLLWTYITGFAILLGGELNAELERSRGRRSSAPAT